MKEYLFPIVQETAGRTIVIEDVPETMTVDNILAIINKTQGKPVIGPLNMGDITDFDFDDGTITITVSNNLPALAVGDKLLVKCFTITESSIDTSDLAKQDTLLEVKQATNDTIASQQATITAQSERILAFDGEVADAYDYLEGEGAIMPEDKTIENLPATIEQVVVAVTDMRVARLDIDLTSQFVDVSHIVVVENNKFGNVQGRQNIRSWKGYRVPGLLSAVQQFMNCIYLSQADFTKSDTSNVTVMSSMFRGCTSLQSLDLSSFNTANVTTINEMFYDDRNLQSLDLSSFNTANAVNISFMFYGCGSLESLVGGRSYEDVITNNTRVFDGININIDCYLTSTQIDRASIRAIINGLADRTGQSALMLKIGATLLAKLSADDIAVATNKNWTIA